MADWISVTEASKLVAYHPDHLRVLIREGKIKARKIVTVWQVDRTSLMAYLRNQDKQGKKRGRKKQEG
jgi:excisionase family DNA binding protein